MIHTITSEEIHTVTAEEKHKPLLNALKEECKKCHACSKGKNEKLMCERRNTIIARFVLSRYSASCLEQIPVLHYVRGIRTHGYTGEIHTTTTVTL